MWGLAFSPSLSILDYAAVLLLTFPEKAGSLQSAWIVLRKHGRQKGNPVH